jgi:hypothetical protein
MDAYEIFWKIKSLWMQNCEKVSGNNTRPQYMKIVVQNNGKYEKVVDVIFNEKLKSVEIITEDENDKEKI